MQLTTRQPLASYSVEVSGWDDSDSFFVEKSELCWNEETGKQLTLGRHLRPGAMVFVRLLQPIDADRSFPVAYEAEPVSKMSGSGQQFRLKRVVPRNIGKR